MRTTVATDVDVTWVEKYLTYVQGPDGELHLTDIHFLAEICFYHARAFDEITATLHSSLRPSLATYGPKDQRAFTNGAFYTRKSLSFPDVASLEARFPPRTQFNWEIAGPSGHVRLAPIRIGGAAAATCFPKVSAIRLSQNGSGVRDFQHLDPGGDLTVEFDRLTTSGPRLAESLFNDFTFLLVSNHAGEVVFTGGMPNASEPFLDDTATSATVPAGTMSPGEEYVVFISQVHAVDFNRSFGIEQLAHNSFAVEASVRTVGQPPQASRVRGRKAQYLWSRKTKGPELETWPTLADHWL